MKRAFAVTALLVVLVGCGDNDGGDAEPPATPNVQKKRGVTVVETGFTQADGYVTGVATVQSDDAAAGWNIVLTMNFIGEDGEVITSAEQTENFSSPGQMLIVPIVDNLPDQSDRVIAVQATVAVGGDASQEAAPLPMFTTEDVAKDEFGDWAARFELTNDRGADLDSVRLGVLCRNAAGAIIGGSSEYVDTIAADGEMQLTAHPNVDEQPTSCEATVNETDF